jgi:hypothetical protein
MWYCKPKVVGSGESTNDMSLISNRHHHAQLATTENFTMFPTLLRRRRRRRRRAGVKNPA